MANWPPRRNPGLGIMLLCARLLNLGVNRIPPVTLAAITGMVLLYLRIIPVHWSVYEVCLSAKSILFFRDYKRMVWSSFEHADDMHLYYNMGSFLWKGITLEERKFTSTGFAALLVVFVAMTNTMYIILSVIAAKLLEDSSYMDQCAIGFSGVIFGLKVLTNYYSPHEFMRFAGFSIPVRWTVWFELILIQILVPNASGIGHLAGILVGLAYIHGPLKSILDSIII